jgi:hypothetical protein
MASDGEAIQVWAEATPSDKAPVKYLTSAHGVISGEEFERETDRFLEGVLARLNAVDVRDTELHLLCVELSEERANVELATYRRLEAIAGFDAGEGPHNVLAQLEALVPEAGIGAVQEIATLCTSSESGKTLADTKRLACEPGLQARLNKVVMQPLDAHVYRRTPAWMRGKEIARTLRRRLAMDGHPVSDSTLCDVLGISPERMLDAPNSAAVPLGLAVRQGQEHLSLHPRRRSVPGRRFELARFVCDHLIAAEKDRWLPVTDGKTSRQKVQRAFAAEFLCPVDDLTSYLDGDFSDDAIEDAATHFRVGTWAVESQLVNNGVVPRSMLPGFGEEAMFPYSTAARLSGSSQSSSAGT